MPAQRRNAAGSRRVESDLRFSRIFWAAGQTYTISNGTRKSVSSASPSTDGSAAARAVRRPRLHPAPHSAGPWRRSAGRVPKRRRTRQSCRGRGAQASHTIAPTGSRGELHLTENTLPTPPSVRWHRDGSVCFNRRSVRYANLSNMAEGFPVVLALIVHESWVV